MIFLNYSRAHASQAGRLFLALRDTLPGLCAEDAFLDVESIGAGANWRDSIAAAIEGCTACLVLIGAGWESAKGDDERVKLADPDGVLRLEIELARAAARRVIPVLIEGRQGLPQPERLPESLRFLCDCQAVRLAHESYSRDALHLASAICATGAAAAPADADLVADLRARLGATPPPMAPAQTVERLVRPVETGPAKKQFVLNPAVYLAAEDRAPESLMREAKALSTAARLTKRKVSAALSGAPVSKRTARRLSEALGARGPDGRAFTLFR